MTVATAVVRAASRRLKKNERTNGPLFAKLTYHWKDRPSGGKRRKRRALRLAITTFTMGTTTSRQPAKTPGRESGNTTRQNARAADAPRLRAAGTRSGGIVSSVPESDSTMNGR